MRLYIASRENLSPPPPKPPELPALAAGRCRGEQPTAMASRPLHVCWLKDTFRPRSRTTLHDDRRNRRPGAGTTSIYRPTVPNFRSVAMVDVEMTATYDDFKFDGIVAPTAEARQLA